MKWLAVLLLLGGACAQTGPLGVEVAYEYVNYAHLLRKWSPLSGSNLSVDADGWPMQDVMGVLFDLRPAHAWAPPIDDPEQRQLNLTGVWKLSLTGYAELSLAQAQGITLSNTAYNAATNQLTADITFAPGKYPQVADLVIVNFKNTRRLPNGQSNTGFVGLKFIHPDYVTKPTQMFTDNLAKLLQPFDHMRFMGILGTNYNPWRCAPDSHGDAISCSVLEWTDRALPSHAYFGDTSLCSGCVGTPWEYVVLLANQLNKDVWVNIPVSASGAGFKGTRTPSNDQQTYIYQIAKLLRDGNAATNNVGLAAHLNIYVEHSNEVWNYGFGQSGFNKAAAELAVKNGNSQLDNNKIQCGNGTPHPCCNNTSPDTWHNRRHAERLYQIAKEFETVFGSGSLNTRIRPIYAWWSLMNCLGVPAMNETLAWMEATYGPVKSYFYGLSAAHYFGPPGGEATVQATLEAYQRSSDAGAATTTALTALAKQYGLKHTAYEAGPGHDVGNQTNLATFIETNRNAGIAAIVERDVRTNFWALGGEIYNYFSSEGYCSMYGCWGATEDFKDLNTPKLQAIHALTGRFPNDQHSPGPIAKDPAA